MGVDHRLTTVDDRRDTSRYPPLLSIWIPTFNRAQSLKNLLDSLGVQSKSFVREGIVEIIVSDNASQDATRKLCEQYAEIVVYRRREKNLGFDRNFSDAFWESSGEFVWTIGDDDYLYSGSLAKIIAALEKRDELSDVSLIKLSFSTSPSSPTGPKGGLSSSDRRMNPAEAIASLGLDELLRMSTSIFRRVDAQPSGKRAIHHGWDISPLEHALFALSKGNVLSTVIPAIFCNEGEDHQLEWRSRWRFISNVAMPFVLMENKRNLEKRSNQRIRVRFFRKGVSEQSLQEARRRLHRSQLFQLLARLLFDRRFYYHLYDRLLKPLSEPDSTTQRHADSRKNR